MALTKEVSVFDYDEAVNTGRAVDQRGNIHTIIASSKQFLITELGEQEYCFDRTGAERANFATFRLQNPVRRETKIKHCIAYNPETMIPYEGFDYLKEANAFVEYLVNKNEPVDLIGNTTFPGYKPVLVELGLIKE